MNSPSSPTRGVRVRVPPPTRTPTATAVLCAQRLRVHSRCPSFAHLEGHIEKFSRQMGDLSVRVASRYLHLTGLESGDE